MKNLLRALVVTGLLVFALTAVTGRGEEPLRSDAAQGSVVALVIPSALAQQPRESPPNIVRTPQRSQRMGSWVRWVLLLGIPAVIVAWVVARRRRMRRRGDGKE